MIQKLIEKLDGFDIDGYILSTKDEYQNEYSPDHLKRLEFITGFSGSNGFCIIAKDFGILITDGRYTAQAEIEIDTSFFKIFNQNNLSENSEFLALLQGKNIGYDPKTFTLKQIEFFKKMNLEMVSVDQNLVDLIWERAHKFKDIYEYSIDFAGISCDQKLKMAFDYAKKSKFRHIIVTDSAISCWLLNIRSCDVEFSPIVNCISIVSQGNIIVYTARNPKTIKVDHVDPNIVLFRNIADLYNDLSKLEGVICIDKSSCPSSLIDSINEEKASILFKSSKFELDKAKKTPKEIENAVKFHITDAIAICELFGWIYKNAGSISEFEVSEKLVEIRSGCFGYVTESFPMICGYESNGSIIHYRPRKNACKKIDKRGILLIDCGAHYMGCTTDVTRVLSLSEPTDEQKLMYTLVLMGHIDVATLKFRKGTSGANIDSFARRYLWDRGLDYDHGTGHGVGNFLSVHEGPISINSINSVALEENMIISNEPGFYKKNEYGIRIENLVYVKKALITSIYEDSSNEMMQQRASELEFWKNGSNERFLEFENLTMLPYCCRLIDKSLLNESHISYIKNYYAKISRLVLPSLSEDASNILQQELEFFI